MLDGAAANTPFVENLLLCLKMDKRFKQDLYKTTAPFNILCALDPRCDTSDKLFNRDAVSRYSDLYFTEEQCDEIIEKMETAPVYDDQVVGAVEPTAESLAESPTSTRRWDWVSD